MIAAGLGKVIYDETPTIEYRRTGSNVSPSGKGAIELQLYRIKKFLFGKYFKNIRKQIYKYKLQYLEKLNNENKAVINSFSLNYSLVKSLKKYFIQKCIDKN